jgi:predicted DsbA family dithiol-disulfide isomerase
VTDQRALSIDVVSDVVCPWCFVGKRRLEEAVARAGVPIEVRWRPFQLDPTIPPEGKGRREYLEGKFGSLERVRPMHDRLVEIGRAEGIAFDFDRIAISPNTLDAHRLVRWAGETGRQQEMVEALFRAYFLEGRNIGAHTVLADVAAEVGLPRAGIAARLATDEDRDAVAAEIAAAQRIGVTGVPTFILAGRYGIAGAQAAEQLADAIKAAYSAGNGASRPAS